MGSSGSIPPDFTGDNFDEWNFLSDRFSSSGNLQAVYAPKGKNRGGRRPQKIITKEELLKYRKYPLKEAANRLNASESTVKRRCKDHGYDSWAEVRQQSAISMPDEDEVVVILHQIHKGIKVGFLLPRKSTVQQLRESIESSLLLPAGTSYDVKYIAEGLEFSIVGQLGLDVCLSLASQCANPPCKSIKLMVEVVGQLK